ncbi:MAG: hypothetical protein JSV03_09925, partial [Planctomycetota bacterium]
VLYYSFDKHEETKVHDISGKQKHAQVYGPKHTKNGIAGGAMYFDGENDFLSIPNIHLAKFSFSAWITTLQTAGPINNRRIFLLDDGKNYYALQGNIRGAIGVDVTGHREVNEYNWSFELDTWTHIVVTHDGSNFKIYKNGELTETGDINTAGVSGTAHIGGIDRFNGNFWHGKMDEVAIFNRALTPQEIKQLYRIIDSSKTTTRDTFKKTTDRKLLTTTVDLSFRTPDDLNQFVISGGDFKIEDNALVATCPGGNNWATYKTHYKKISSVLIRGQIVLPCYQEFRIWVGPIHMIFNWKNALQNHYRNNAVCTTTTPYALTPGKWQDIELKQVDNMVLVWVDKKIIYTTEAVLQGTVSVQSAVNSTIAVQRIKIVGQPDPSVKVKPETRGLPPVDSKMKKAKEPWYYYSTPETETVPTKESENNIKTPDSEPKTAKQTKATIDLYIDDFRIKSYSAGGLYYVVVSIRNKGNYTSPDFGVHFFRDDPDKQKPATHGAGKIKPGGTFNEASMPFALKEGVNNIDVVIDPDNTVAESNENNNSASMRVVVKEGKIAEKSVIVQTRKISSKKTKATFIDLAIENFKIHPYPEGGLFSVTVSIRNKGDSISPEFPVYFYRVYPEKKKPMTHGAGPIKPGNVWNERSMPFVLKEGVNNIDVVIDPDNTVVESNENNNSASLKVIIKEDKIVEQSVEYSPSLDRSAKPYIPATSKIDENGRIVDKIDYPFVNDPQAIGGWRSVDFVGKIEDFKPGIKSFKDDFFLKEIFIFEKGKTSWAFTWTKGLFIHNGNKTAAKYHIRQIDGSTYMFMEWKSGDYTIRHMKPQYYVLKKDDTLVYVESRTVDKIDHPFVNDPEVIGTWKSVDFVGKPEKFNPNKKYWVGDLYLTELVILPNGETPDPNVTWTRGLILDSDNKTASKYILKQMNGSTYMFFEWKSGDYIFRQAKPGYYVLKKVPSDE